MIRDLYPEPLPPSPDKRDALERRLLARFDQLHPQQEVPVFQKKRLLFALALLLGVSVALGSPAQYAVEVGKKITIHEAWPAGQGPELAALISELRGWGQKLQVEMRLQGSGASRDLEVTVFGENIPADIEQRLRARFPGLKDARIDVASVEGRVQSSLAGLLRAKLLQAGDDPEKIEAARREVQAELQRQYPGASVDVQHTGGKTQVKVIKKK